MAGGFTRVWTEDEMNWVMVPDSCITEELLKKGQVRITWGTKVWDIRRVGGKLVAKKKIERKV